MRGVPRSPALRYLAAAAIFVIALLTRVLLDAVWSRGQVPFITLFPAIMGAAWWLGRGPGLVVVVAGAAAAAHLWVAPIEHVSEMDAAEGTALLAFLVLGVSMVLLADSARGRGIRLEAANAQIRRDLGELERAQAALRDSDRRKDEFLAMLGHELRNPIAAVRAAAAVLAKRESQDVESRRAAEIIERQVRMLDAMLGDLLDLARLTNGKIALSRRVLDLGALVRSAVDVIQSSGRADKHVVSVDAESVLIDGDETRLVQIIENLVGNALKYTPEGGRIRVLTRAAGDVAELVVEDSGVGIAPDLLPHVFDLFRQAPTSLERAQGGLGLGLTLVKRLTDLHGGHVSAESRGVGQGSSFVVRLPRATEASVVHAPAPSTPVERAGSKRRVVLVEDNVDAREMLRALLELEGHAVDEAADGPSGVEQVLAKRPDLAFIDLGLPGFDGFEVARRIRAASEAREIMLVALSGYGQSEDRRRTAEAGFDLHLVKPVSPEVLFELLARGACQTTQSLAPLEACDGRSST